MVDLERIVPLDPGGCAAPLFCVHAVSGSAYVYHALAGLIGGDRPVYGIEAPGFDGDREPVRSLPALSAEYAATLAAFQPDGELALLGWSLGGVIAIDLARRLAAAGRTVSRVVLVDVSVPWVAELPPEREIVRRFLDDLLAGQGVESPVLERLLGGQRADAEAAFRAVERSGVLPAGLDAELLAERYAVFRAHVEASYGFEVTEPYHGPVVHLIASRSDSPQLRWQRLATDLTEHLVPGSHHSIWSGDGLARLAHLVRAALAGAG
jgi:thioesterase domain-containing protein